MSLDDISASSRPAGSLREFFADRREAALTGTAVVAGVVLAESLLFAGETWPAIWMHCLTLLGCVLLLGRTESPNLLQALALVPLFRLVNMGMPVFFQLTAYWFPLIYGPLVPALVYVDHTRDDLSVPLGLRRGVLLVPVAIGIGFLLAEVEQSIIQSEALIPTWSLAQVAMITVVMICFVGFVEEYLFRGILQETLQAEIGRWPGIVLASALFGIMHSGYGIGAEIVFAGVIGFVFGVLYDYLDSLAFVTIVHGILNVFLFAVFPIHGSLLF